MDIYKNKVEKLEAEIRRLKSRNKFFVSAEIISFLAAAAFIVAVCAQSIGSIGLIIAFLLLAIYAFIRRIDSKNSETAEHYGNLRMVYEKEIAYHDGDFSHFDAGERYADPSHEFSFDMDIFGKESLYNRINRTITTGGSDFLAGELSDCRVRRLDDIRRRREAVNELAGRLELRADFLSFGQKETIDTEKINRALEQAKTISIPRFAGSSLALATAILVILGFYVSLILAIIGIAGANLPIWWGVIQFFVIFMAVSRPIKEITKVVGCVHAQLKSYIRLIETIAASGLEAEENKSIIAMLSSDESDALLSFKELKDIIDGLDRRANILGLFVFNILFLSDFFLVRRFLKWQDKYMPVIDRWIEAVNRFDAITSMATFRYNEPEATDAELVESDSLIYHAEGIYHPFLGKKAVANDFDIDDGNYYIVTGANMAGKSTFLRSIGINYILASNGMPVFARKLSASLFSLFSSMRTTDDLSHGISYFNAELLRLRQLAEYCRKNKHTLIILDEILKGTNSLDKLNGSRLFLQFISSLPVTGIIAIHDLELSQMEKENPDRFHNYCFEIELSEDVRYSYKITKGVARNQNATFLLKKFLSI